MSKGIVYKWTDASNGMMYIGSHKGTIDDGYIGGGVRFNRAFSKRPNKFTREIIDYTEHYRELEEFILETVDAMNSKFYYNLKNTAIGGGHNKGVPISEAQKKLQSDKMKGSVPWNTGMKNHLSKETCKSISDNVKKYLKEKGHVWRRTGRIPDEEKIRRAKYLFDYNGKTYTAFMLSEELGFVSRTALLAYARGAWSGIKLRPLNINIKLNNNESN